VGVARAAPIMTTLQAMQSPHIVQRSWEMSRGAPIVPHPKKLVIRTLSSKDPVQIETPVGMTVGDLKYEIAQRMVLMPRKALSLRWYGSLLEDQYGLPHYRIPDGAMIEMAMHPRPAAEIEQLQRDMKQVRVKGMDGKVFVIEGVKQSTKVFEIKKTIAERKLFKPEEGFLPVDPKNPVCELFYSTVFGATFGISLDDEKTVGSYGMLNDDVVLFKPAIDEEFVAAAAAAAKKGKK